jgi:hypothetical protein
VNGFFFVVTVGFAGLALYALGLALDYRGWRTAEVYRTFPPDMEGVDTPRRALDIFARVATWIVFAASTFAFGCAVVATAGTM